MMENVKDVAQDGTKIFGLSIFDIILETKKKQDTLLLNLKHLWVFSQKLVIMKSTKNQLKDWTLENARSSRTNMDRCSVSTGVPEAAGGGIHIRDLSAPGKGKKKNQQKK